MSAAQARVKESAAPLIRPRAPGPANETPPEILQMQEDARALSRKLGRPLRTDIPDPLSEADWEELILARILNYDKRVSAEALLEEFAHLRRKPRKNPR